MQTNLKQNKTPDAGYLANLAHNFRKSWGQNFLRYCEDAGKLVDKIDLTDNMAVLEIGVGGGALTAALLNRNVTVYAYEIDKTLETFLNLRFAESLERGRLHLSFTDALAADWTQLFAQFEKVAVVSNLPYSLTRELINKIYRELGEKIGILALMLQKEAINRLLCPPPGRTNYQAKLYGLQAVITQMLFRSVERYKIPRQAFFPVPHVDNEFLIMTTAKTGEEKSDIYFPRQNSMRDQNLWLYFIDFLQTAFQNRRKQIRNCFSTLPNEQLSAILLKAGLPLTVRAEELTPQQLWQIACELFEVKNG